MNVQFSPSDLAPLVKQIAAEVLDQLQEQEARVNGRLAYTEPEAASLLGLKPYVLRDCRLRGEIKASRVGKRTIYTRDELVEFLRRTQI